MQILLLVRFARHGCPTMETDKVQNLFLLLDGSFRRSRKFCSLPAWEKGFSRAETPRTRSDGEAVVPSEQAV
jgi:hypothetical protein